MKKLNNLMEQLNAPIDEEQLRQIVHIIFAVVIFLLPIVPELIGTFVHSLKCTVFNVVTIATSIILLLTSIGEKELKFNKYDIILTVYLILVIVSGLLTKYGIVSCLLGTNGRGEGIITILSYAATFCIMSKGYKYLKNTIKIAILGAVIVSIYSILQAVVPLEYDLIIREKNIFGIATGTMRNQNFLSSYICIFLPMMCYYYLNAKKKTTLLVISLLFAALIFAQTLGGYLTFAGMYIIIVVFEFWRSNNRKSTLFSTLVLTLVLLSTFGLTNIKSNSYIDEIKSTKKEVVNLKNNDNSFATSRLTIWKKTLRVINNNKLLGTGPDSLKCEIMTKKYRTDGEKDMLNHIIVDKAHCEYLQIAATTGIPSLIIYLIFIGTLMTEILKRVLLNAINFKRKGDYNDKSSENIYLTILFIGIGSYLIQAVGNISVVQVAPVFWAIMGLAAGNIINETN